MHWSYDNLNYLGTVIVKTCKEFETVANSIFIQTEKTVYVYLYFYLTIKIHLYQYNTMSDTWIYFICKL